MSSEAEQKAASLSCWEGPVTPQPLAGGLTNANFTVIDNGAKFVVRIGADIPQHGIMRFNELNASRAAAAAGISPKVRHWEPGALVMEFIDGKTLKAADIRRPDMLARIVPLIQRVHTEIPNYLEGAVLMFWVFQVLRDYRRVLKKDGSRMVPQLQRLERVAGQLEEAVGSIKVVFGHNDLLAANFIDDGSRLWLIDWDYGGFNCALFDLANLASNNEFDEKMDRHLLHSYFGTVADSPIDSGVWRAYVAIKCASLLREAMWSMVSEIHSTIKFDYVAYTDDNMARFERALEEFRRG